MNSLETPFTGGVPAVFIHVSDMEKSVAWYSQLLGHTKPELKGSSFYIFGLNNGANIFLEHTENPDPSSQVLCSLPAPDLVKCRVFFESNNIEYENISEETIHFKDLDGNILMACSI